MKLTRIIPVVAIATLDMLASCKSGNKTDAAATEGAATTTEATTAAPAKSADEIALEKATTLKGWIKAIAGDSVTIVDANGNETQVKVVNAYDELIEGAPIEVKYIDDNGTKKTATGDNKSLSLSQNYKKLLGKWATEGDKITFELRKSGKAKTSMKNFDFQSWKLVGDNAIEFEVKNKDGQKQNITFNVESFNGDELVLSTGEGDKKTNFPMKRKDSNRE
jgi:uncharacterized protein YdeI (BOF family)